MASRRSIRAECRRKPRAGRCRIADDAFDFDHRQLIQFNYSINNSLTITLAGALPPTSFRTSLSPLTPTLLSLQRGRVIDIHGVGVSEQFSVVIDW